jgi:hypothetical protein
MAATTDLKIFCQNQLSPFFIATTLNGHPPKHNPFKNRIYLDFIHHSDQML